jgi:glycosyltransferase involved in cell wall biosynthesis
VRDPSSNTVTYLVANYNQAEYVGHCIQSLVAQRSPRWRAIVVDDASTDGSLEVIRSHPDERIRLLVNERNLGYIASLRRLIDAAETDIVAILDADDLVTPDATGELLRVYDNNPDAEFVYSRYAKYDAQLLLESSVHGAAVPPLRSAICDGVVGALRSFRRSAYRRTSGLDESMLYAEDRDLVYKLEEVTTPIFIDAVLYHYRQAPGSHTNDPVKREIGAKNVRRARRVALARRTLPRAERWCLEVFALADYVAYSGRHTTPIRWLARGLARVARRLSHLVARSTARRRA